MEEDKQKKGGYICYKHHIMVPVGRDCEDCIREGTQRKDKKYGKKSVQALRPIKGDF